ncbi:MAG TPA: hydroxymethylglutaryl-CoA reductase, partial [Bacteroidia bacterium]|nr:hydroxymethylglutaryl-CoA reductase [Bacteroidia bacterium]
MNQIISGFSKLSKDDKIKLVTSKLSDPSSAENLLKSYWHRYPEVQKLLDEFSENTLTNYFIPYGVAPNFLINGKFYFVPMVIEESSVIAAAANAAKYWASRGGFHAQIISSVKIGQVHFIWKGDYNKLNSVFNELKFRLKDETQHITANMIKRGGGILDIQLVDMRHEIEDYFQLKATFETVDS